MSTTPDSLNVVFNKTRIAPTPSGFLHLGNVLSFSLTAALARKTNASILLRIDDLDRERANPLYVQDIFDTLNFLEIPWDEGPRNFQEFKSDWSQVHRLPHYQQALQQLKENRAVFACTCSRSQLRQPGGSEGIYPGTCRDHTVFNDTVNANWRLLTDVVTPLFVRTLPCSELIQATLPDSMQDFVIKKKDGYPAYQLASMIDDLHFGVDLIVRGEDLWPSTLAQLYLAQQLGNNNFASCTFLHHRLLNEPTGQKLSKSAGATSIRYLRQQGYKVADVFSSIAQMLGLHEISATWQDLAELMNI
ncbi:tRNA glutamyl-Q synthetase [Mucilaginibacter robiniae]|uniref:tRNA glutamyl-Q synthetase n=1 Tax=Mucilaginibacter robiniae TaxID=2728022 RepID=A0A7L5DZE3_9SPHI|nr:glutamate--tRNA ligase family protein [Mucilaginibacter robiniae]QJD94644.1 tRNA glutamyl-Q synthetase [Mucilaginibacter robiniae]